MTKPRQKETGIETKGKGTEGDGNKGDGDRGNRGRQRQGWGDQRAGRGRKQEAARGRGPRWMGVASVPALCTRTPAQPQPGCLQKEASSVVRPPQARRRPPPALNKILVQSCGRWGRAAEAPQRLCSRLKGARAVAGAQVAAGAVEEGNQTKPGRPLR